MAEEVRIRTATAEDLRAVLALWRSDRSPHAVTPDRKPDLQRLITHGPESLLVAEADRGEIVGTLIAAWDGWRGNMYRLTVAESHRRRRIGLALVEAGHERLRAAGARRITALVAREDDQATPFGRRPATSATWPSRATSATCRSSPDRFERLETHSQA